MKFNWGHGITLSLIGFIGFIAFLVRGTYMERVDLTSDDYYAREVQYDSERAELIAGLEKGQISITSTSTELIVDLPETGWENLTLYLLRPDNAQLDLEVISDQPETGTIAIDRPIGGVWRVEVIAVLDGKTYRWKEVERL